MQPLKPVQSTRLAQPPAYRPTIKERYQGCLRLHQRGNARGRNDRQHSQQQPPQPGATTVPARQEPEADDEVEQQDAEAEAERLRWKAPWATYERPWAVHPLRRPVGEGIPWPVEDGKQSSVNGKDVRDFFLHAPPVLKRDDAAFSRLLERQLVRWFPSRMAVSFAEMRQDKDILQCMKLVRNVLLDLLEVATEQAAASDS